jgi:membrane protein
MPRYFEFSREVVSGWLNAGAIRLAAALAYYAIFAIAPLLLLSIHIAALFIDRGAAVDRITAQFSGIIGPAGSGAIQQMLQAAGTGEPQGWAGAIGLGVLLFAAAGFVGSLQDALDTIWEAPTRGDSGVWTFIRSKFLSFSLVLSAALLLLISLVLTAVISAFAEMGAHALALPDWLLFVVTFLSNLVLTALIFTLVFKYVPSVPVTWRAAWWGGLFTAFLFALGRFALGWYLGREAEASPYGAATSLVLLLVWVYYSAQILFLGAEVSRCVEAPRVRGENANIASRGDRA